MRSHSRDYHTPPPALSSAIVAGLFLGSHGDLRFTTEQFAAVVIVLAGLALLAALRKSAALHEVKAA